MDIYRKFSQNHVSESKLISIGRNTVVLSLLVAVIVAKPLLEVLIQFFNTYKTLLAYLHQEY